MRCTKLTEEMLAVSAQESHNDDTEASIVIRSLASCTQRTEPRLQPL